MHFTTATLLSPLLGLAAAQTVHVVQVSNATGKDLAYSPNSVTAEVGDMVQFQFMGGNHTVTQSTFDQPCQPIAIKSANVTGFHSGFMDVAASMAQGMIPTFTVAITSKTPIWAYCAQAKHCESGMVMVINENTTANSTRSLANFMALASKVTQTVIPNDATSPNSSTGGSTGTTTTSGSSASGSATAAASAGSLVRAPATVGLLAVAAAFFAL